MARNLVLAGTALRIFGSPDKYISQKVKSAVRKTLSRAASEYELMLQHCVVCRENKCFENVAKFRYFETTPTNQICMHK
jgi:hypothetical protein